MLFTQFPPPSTSNLENGVHSRPSRLRRFSNLRNYRSAVTGAVSTGSLNRSGSSSTSASNAAGTSASATTSPTTRPSPDLLLTRSVTLNHVGSGSGSSSSNSKNNNISRPALSPSSSSELSSGSSQQLLAVAEPGDGNPLTKVNSAPNFATPSTPSSSTSNGATVAASTNNPTVNGSSDSASPAAISLNPPTDSQQIQPASGDTASISDVASSSMGEDTPSESESAPSMTANAVPADALTPSAFAANTSASTEPAVPSNNDQQEQPATMTRQRPSTTGDSAASTEAGNVPPAAATKVLPSLRLSAYYDPRSTRPSLSFPPISRTLPSGTETIRVGRYSERDSHAMSSNPGNQPSSSPVGFKSKVVSRRHCEFWYENGKWYIKDVKSSSGTFLNHIRLSPPSQESKAFPVNDGDIVQLGIDFKGGEEMIFRCVKMRLEINRGWQNKLNTFNVAAHKRLRTMGTGAPGATSGSSDCSICLNSIAPCQSLFVAPCSHTWHFKCVRSLLTSPQYPIFICPNCRAGADLEADVDDPAEDWQDVGVPEQADDEASDVPVETPETAFKAPAAGVAVAAAPEISTPPSDDNNSDMDVEDPMDVTVNMTASELPQTLGSPSHTASEPLPIRNTASGAGRAISSGDNATIPLGNNGEGLVTPRNNAGPWVFDGTGGQGDVTMTGNGMRSLDAAADLDMNQLSSDASSR